MRCPSCHTENREGRRFCAECGVSLAVECPECGSVNEPNEKFCGGCGAKLARPAAGGAPAVPAAGVTSHLGVPSSYTPKHLAERIVTSRAALEGERKHVTVLFADVKGSMEVLAERDPEEAHRVLDGVLERMLDAVHHYEGTVNQVRNYGIMALFGAPLAHEDHAVRACYAALRMQEAIGRYTEEMRRSHGIAVQMRVGLNSGDVVVRAIRNDLQVDYSAVGQTVHLAARMEQLAAPGSILLTADTLELAEGFVHVKPLGPVPVKGLEARIEVYEVVGAGLVRHRLEAAAIHGLTRFVGRQAEIDTLRHALEHVAAGHGQVVGVVGEPGVGKSRLFWEFTHSHRLHDWLILESRSVSYGKATAYLPVIDLLKAYFRIQDVDEPRTIREKVTGKLLTLDRTLEPTLPAFLALLDIPLEDAAWQSLDPRQRRERTHGAVKRLLLRESRVQPLCLVFEDLHWIDDETQAVLDTLIEGLSGTRVLLLVNYRPEYQHGWESKTYYTRLRMDALSPETAEELLQALLGEDARLRPLKQLLIERTEGNPFFLEETVRTLVESHALSGRRGAYRLMQGLPDVHVPATVQAVLAARIDRLSPEDKRLLQSAAVVGKDVPFALLQPIAGLPDPELRAGLSRLLAAEFLYEATLFPELEYTFKHALTHEVAYAGLLHTHRTALHAKVAHAIQRLAGERRTDQAEALAHHAIRGEVWDIAVDALRVAGIKAYARGAIQESLARYEQALEFLPRLVPSPETIRRGIDVRFRFYAPLLSLGQLPRLTSLIQDAEQLARQLGEPRRIAYACLYRAGCAIMTGRCREAVEWATQAARVTASFSDPGLSLRVAVVLGTGHHGLGQERITVERLTPVVDGPDADLARAIPGVFGSLYTMSCGFLSASYARMGQFAAASSYATRAVEAAEASGIPQAQTFALFYQALMFIEKGEPQHAVPLMERAVHLAETQGMVYWLAIAFTTLGWALARSGRPVEGLPTLERGVTLHEPLGTKFRAPIFYIAWADALLLAGRSQEARRVAERARDVAIEVEDRGHEAWALWVLGRSAAALIPPDTTTAFAAYGRAMTLASEGDSRAVLAQCHLDLAKLLRCAGQGTQARQHLATAVAMFRAMDMGSWLEQAEAELRTLS